MLGNRALYHDGWVAGCLHGRLPWLTSGGASFDEDSWELYNIEKDFSQANDLAASEPQKLRELQDRFMAEAAKYNVLPLDDRFAQRADPKLHPSHIRGKTKFVYAPGTVRLGERSSPNTKNVHHTLAAEVEIPKSGAEGVLVCCGGISGGFSSSSRTASFTGSTTTTTRSTIACRRRRRSRRGITCSLPR
jgi:arylsulfatase